MPSNDANKYYSRPLGKLIVKPYKSIATPAIETLCA
jgi:hypothetical protein